MDKSQKLDSIFFILEKIMIEPNTELKFKNDFTFLVAIILSAQTTDILVNKATKELFEVANSPEEFLKLGVEGLAKYISTLNLYPTKAKNIIKSCEILSEKFNSKVPDNFDDLISLPGVGRKTANVFLNNLHGYSFFQLDKNFKQNKIKF